MVATRESSEATKLRLIKAASDIMREEDRISITLQEVSAKSGMNAALVRYHFGNKEGLLFAVLERDILTALEALERLLQRDALSPEEQMRLHISGMVEAYARIPYLHRLIQLMTRDAAKERVQWIANDAIKKIAEGQKDILDRGVAQGLFRQVDPISLYFTIVGAAGSLYSQRFVLNTAFGLDQVTPEIHRANVDQITDLLMRGLLISPPSTSPLT